MEYTEARKLVKARLSEKRWTHTKNVKKMAVKLAKRWGADPEKAAMAAILHDSAKELPKQELLQIFADNAIIAENAPARPLPVWHGIAAAILAETQWGITDPEILSAIRCHTTGKPGMSKLDKIIYLADMTGLFATHSSAALILWKKRAARWTLKASPLMSMQKHTLNKNTPQSREEM